MVYKVPPFKIKCPTVAVPGAVPKRASELIDNVPADIVVAPVYVLDPDNVNVPDPALVNAKAPDHCQMAPVIELAPELVILSVQFPPMLTADKTFVVILILLKT